MIKPLSVINQILRQTLKVGVSYSISSVPIAIPTYTCSVRVLVPQHNHKFTSHNCIQHRRRVMPRNRPYAREKRRRSVSSSGEVASGKFSPLSNRFYFDHVWFRVEIWQNTQKMHSQPRRHVRKNPGQHVWRLKKRKIYPKLTAMW